MKKTVTAIAISIASLVAANASAGNIGYLGAGKVATISIHSPVLGDMTVNAGESEWTWTSGKPASSPLNFYAYALDVNTNMTDPQKMTVKSTALLTNAAVSNASNRAAWLYDTYAGDIDSTGLGEDAAALQVAIWAALYNPTNTLNGPGFALNTTGT